MLVRAPTDACFDCPTIERDHMDTLILARTRIVLWVLLLAGIPFACADVILRSHDQRALGAEHVVLAIAAAALLRLARGPWAMRRAVPLALLTFAVGCVQAALPGMLRGQIAIPAALVIALGAGVSVVIPWGVGTQLAATAIAGLTAIVTLVNATAPLNATLLAYPATAAGIAFGASLFAAHLSRRDYIMTIQREFERKRAEAALRASEEQMRHQLMQLDALYRTAPVGFALVDTQLYYLRVNETLAEMNGLPAQAHIGRSIRDVVPEIADAVEPLYRSVIASGQPIRDRELSGSTSQQPGMIRDWRVDYWPLKDPDGAVVAVNCVVQEITAQKRAQEALRENEARLRTVSEATNDAVWDWNLTTDEIWWNEGVQTLFDYTAAEVGSSVTWWYDHIHPAERKTVIAGVHAVIDNGERHWSAEYRYRRGDGSYAYVFDRCYVFHDPDGTPVRMIGAIMDISERRRAEEALAMLNTELEQRVHERTAQLEAANRRLEHEIAERRQAAEALRESQRQLQDILDNATAVIFLKDTAGRYLLINRQYEKLFHVSREQIVGKTDYDFFPREAADIYGTNDRRVLTANRALSFEETVPQDDGAHTYVSVKFPLRDGSGMPYGVCGIATDITARKHMEAELRTSQAQLSALIENTTDGIWSVDRDYRLTAFNSVVAHTFRNTYGRELSLGAPFERRAPEEESGHWRPFYDRVLAGERLRFEREYGTAEEPRAFLMSMTPIVADGQVTGATVFAKDITDLKRAEERARQHQAELTHVLRVSTMGEMAAGLAHEINQPLSAIVNYAQGCSRRIAAGAARPDELLPATDEIAAQALRAGEIIRRLRHLVQKGETAHEIIAPNDIVAEATHVIETQARQEGVALHLELAPGLPRIEVDHIQIEQVIVNLLLNGLEAMHTTNGMKPTLAVRTVLSDDGGVEVSVRDSGVGISSGVVDKMFEPFFTSKPSGLGMGLAISRSIVTGHGGRIWATNNPDGGATFHVTLPAAPHDAASLRARE